MKADAKNVVSPQGPRRQSLRADFTWTLAGNAVYAAGQLAVLMLLAKLVPPEFVGQYALGLAIVYPVMMFTNLQIRAVITSGKRPTLFGNYLGLRLITTSLAFMAVFVITQALHYGPQLTGVVMAVGVAYGIETISEVYYAWLQLHDRMAEIAKSMMVRALVSVIGLALATYISRNVLWGIAGIALGRAVVLFGYDTRERTHGLGTRATWSLRSKALAPRFDFKTQRELLWLSLPLGIVVLLGCLTSSIPNFVIKHVLGDRELGIFAAIGFVISVGNMAVVSLGQSAFTRLARSYGAGDKHTFVSLLAQLLAFGAMLGVFGMVLSKLIGTELLTLLFRAEYAERANLLPWLMAAGGVLYMAQFVGFGLTAVGFYHSQVVINALSNGSLLAACYWLVPRRGLQGAILAMLIAAVVQLAASLILLLAALRRPSRAEGSEPVVANVQMAHKPVFYAAE